MGEMVREGRRTPVSPSSSPRFQAVKTVWVDDDDEEELAAGAEEEGGVDGMEGVCSAKGDDGEEGGPRGGGASRGITEDGEVLVRGERERGISEVVSRFLERDGGLVQEGGDRNGVEEEGGRGDAVGARTPQDILNGVEGGKEARVLGEVAHVPESSDLSEGCTDAVMTPRCGWQVMLPPEEEGRGE